MTAGADRADEADPTAPPLLLVAHGSRTPAATAVTEAVADDVRARLPGVASTSATSTTRRRRSGSAGRGDADRTAGYRRVGTLVVLPLLLTAAAHAKTDIPGALRRRADPGLAAPVRAAARPAAGSVEGGRRAGSRGRRRPRHGRGPGRRRVDRPGCERRGGPGGPPARRDGPFHAVEPAFVTTAEPSVTTAVRRWTRLAEGPVVVAPYLLTPGFLADRCRRDAGPATVADVVGAHHAVTEVVVERYREALGGDIRMNCDVCMYRTPMPGREHLVGVPQLPHRHPDDQL